MPRRWSLWLTCTGPAPRAIRLRAGKVSGCSRMPSISRSVSANAGGAMAPRRGSPSGSTGNYHDFARAAAVLLRCLDPCLVGRGAYSSNRADRRCQAPPVISECLGSGPNF